MKKVLLSLGAIGLLAVQAQAQVLFFDSFEAETAGATGVTNLTNWSASLGNVDVIGNGSGFELYPPFGTNKYVDLDGTLAGATTTLNKKTTVALAGGTTYTLSFDLGKNGTSAEALTVRVTNGLTDLVVRNINDPAGNSRPTFQKQLVTFTTTGAANVGITFTNANTGDNGGFVIDNVGLTQGLLPEPTTMALMGLMGLPLAAALRRRRKG